MAIIPTRHKERLPRGYSYPIGAEVISAAMKDSPHIDDRVLWFAWRDEYWASKYRRKILHEGEIKVLELHRPLPHRTRLIGPDWSIRLCAVPSGHRAAARSGFESRILPAMRPWLDRAARAPRPGRFQAYYSLGDRSVRIST